MVALVWAQHPRIDGCDMCKRSMLLDTRISADVNSTSLFSRSFYFLHINFYFFGVCKMARVAIESYEFSFVVAGRE